LLTVTPPYTYTREKGSDDKNEYMPIWTNGYGVRTGIGAKAPIFVEILEMFLPHL
jgi:hypothetical protein